LLLCCSLKSYSEWLTMDNFFSKKEIRDIKFKFSLLNLHRSSLHAPMTWFCSDVDLAQQI
jgi:hypothetical protein